MVKGEDLKKQFIKEFSEGIKGRGLEKDDRKGFRKRLLNRGRLRVCFIRNQKEEITMSKIILPKEVGKAIENLRRTGIEDAVIISMVVEEADTADDVFTITSSEVANEDLLHALVNGYEVELTPEEELRKYYVESEPQPFDMTYAPDTYDYILGRREGIQKTLDILEIGIEGVNLPESEEGSNVPETEGGTTQDTGEAIKKYRKPTRKEVVKQAQEDVAEWIKEMLGSHPQKRGNNTFRFNITFVDFKVNREKYAVTALVRDQLDGELHEVGVANCAPGDCFNADIGKAIALRRALGLEVPDEYLNAPQPEGKCIGDVCKSYQSLYKNEDGIRTLVGEGKGHRRRITAVVGSLYSENCFVIDDSDREEYK